MTTHRARPTLPDQSGGAAFDLVVIGGGATGLSLALDATLRGFQVALFESHDFASGTSSRSTKLLHGGVRYLAQGQLGLVHEALNERQAMLHIAPHLAQPLSFVMPSYRWWQTPFYGCGLMLYDLMAGQARLGRTRWLSRSQTLQALPGVRRTGLLGGVAYWDGQFDDARMALAFARTAQHHGAQLFNHTEVLELHSNGEGRTTLALRDRLDQTQACVQARCVVNATGVWVDQLRQHALPDSAPHTRLVSPSQGVHLVVDRDFLPGQQALLVPRTRDGRVLFAVPWLGKLVLGTTDTPRPDLPREPEAFAHERQFILEEASAVLQHPVRASDVRSEWVGLRPLVASARMDATGTPQLSREHTIVQDAHGLVSVVGGKWTTCRAMARDVLSHCMANGLLPQRAPAAHLIHLLGTPAPDQPPVPLHQAPGLHLYGSLAPEVLACPGVDNPLGMGLTEAMVRHAVRVEFACCVEDVLARRWRALFLDARQAAQMAPAVADILRDEGVVQTGLEEFLKLCRHCLPHHPPL